MASLLKDLFSLLKALLTLLFVVFLAVTSPSVEPNAPIEAEAGGDAPDELSIPRVVSMRIDLPFSPKGPPGSGQPIVLPR